MSPRPLEKEEDTDNLDVHITGKLALQVIQILLTVPGTEAMQARANIESAIASARVRDDDIASRFIQAGLRFSR